jgi:hypothetical protein
LSDAVNGLQASANRVVKQLASDLCLKIEFFQLRAMMSGTDSASQAAAISRLKISLQDSFSDASLQQLRMLVFFLCLSSFWGVPPRVLLRTALYVSAFYVTGLAVMLIPRIKQQF